MRLFIAKVLRQAFKIKFLKPHFFGLHQRVLKPYNLFKGQQASISYNGFKLNLKIDDWIQEKLFFLGEYEKAELTVLTKTLKKGNTFLDLGANIGVYSLHASRIVGETGQVVSFEPFSINYNALKKHVEMNELSNVKLEKMAVGNENGMLTLYHNESDENLGMVTANFSENAVKEEVEITSIDQYLNEYPITKVDFIKIDIEGFEYPTLLGMKNTLKKHSPTILIEVLDDANNIGNSEKVFGFLNELGYKKYFISDQGELSELEENPKRKNFIFSMK